MVKIVYHPDFRSEAAAIIEYLAARNHVAAFDFIDSLEGVVERLKSFPELGTHPDFLKAKRHEQIWFYLLDQFPDYLVFYRFLGGTIDLLHILHGARDIVDVFKN